MNENQFHLGKSAYEAYKNFLDRRGNVMPSWSELNIDQKSAWQFTAMSTLHEEHSTESTALANEMAELDSAIQPPPIK